MLQIKENNFQKFNRDIHNKYIKIDKKVKRDLRQLKGYSINGLDSFFKDLEKIISLEENSTDSFVMASLKVVKDLTEIKIPKINFLRSELKDDNTSKKLYKIINDTNNSKDDINKAKIKLAENIELNTYLESIFNYKERLDRLILYYSEQDTNNCYYCLAQFTTIYSGLKNNYLKGNLDHIYPKSKNALVSISLNNLIPVCAHCNQRKLDATEKQFDFNPFYTIATHKEPVFDFKDAVKITNGNIEIQNLSEIKIKHINKTLENRLELTKLYSNYKAPIINLLDRYKRFNSSSYQTQIENLLKKDISLSLEYFISETPYTKENIQNVPLKKFKSDFYKELEEYKKKGDIKFS